MIAKSRGNAPNKLIFSKKFWHEKIFKNYSQLMTLVWFLVYKYLITYIFFVFFLSFTPFIWGQNSSYLYLNMYVSKYVYQLRCLNWSLYLYVVLRNPSKKNSDFPQSCDIYSWDIHIIFSSHVSLCIICHRHSKILYSNIFCLPLSSFSNTFFIKSLLETLLFYILSDYGYVDIL